MSAILAFTLSLVSARDLFLLAKADPKPSADIRVEELKAVVYRLASPEFMGRKGPGAARTARYLKAAFQRLKLQPAFGKSFFQPIPSLLANDDHHEARFVGRNVGALLLGSDPRLKDEWIVLSAHYDHLGQIGKLFYPGADDNATGVAMLLEVAKRLTLNKKKPRRSVMFVAFDQEEEGLLGSRYFVTHLPHDIHKLKAGLTADMLGRAMANLMDEYVFALGSEHSARLRNLIEEVKPPAGLTVGRVGADLIGTRSDYGPFRDRRVPFLFFSTGEHPDYHQTTDLPERIDYRKLAKICLWIGILTERLANDEQAPAWDDHGLPPDLDEVRTVSILISRILDYPNLYPLSSQQRDIAQNAQERLAAILRRGKVTASERTWLVWTARLLMVTVF